MKEVIAREYQRYSWTVVGMLWFICFFNYADRVAISSVLPLLEKEFGFSKAQLGLISSAFMWVYALTAPFAGQVGDRGNRKWIILSGLYIWSLITGLTAHCSKLWHFVAVRGAEGLGETFYFPASMSLISDYHSPKTRSRAIGFHQTSVYAGTIGGGAIAGWMAERYGWQSPFWFLGVAGILLGLVLAASIHEPERNAAERWEKAAHGAESIPIEPTLPIGQFLKELLHRPTALLLVAAFFGANLVAMVFLTWMPSFLKTKFGLNLAAAGLGATFFIQLASMGGATLGGILADKWRSRHPGGRIRVQAMGTLLGAPFIFLCGYTQQITTLMVAMTFFGLCKGLYDANIWASLYDVIPASRRSTATGLMNMIGWLGAGLGSIAIGIAVDSGISMSVAISSTAAIYLCITLLLFYSATMTAPRDVTR